MRFEAAEEAGTVEEDEEEALLVDSRGARSRARAALCRAVALGACCAGAASAAAMAFKLSKPPGVEPLRLGRSTEPHFVEYDENASGSLPMPKSAIDYDGIEDTRELVIDRTGDDSRIFVVGDWGALLPSHKTAKCQGWDCTAQIQVAKAMKSHNRLANAQYVLNVGDAFYWAGIQVSCNAPPGAAWGKAKDDFKSGWQGIYAELAAVPWISTLGNHDYGGFRGDMGWPQEIGYSFVNHNWIMPARYYSRKMHHKDWVAEYFIIDSNAFDAKHQDEDPDRNICSRKHNPPGANCGANGGMPNTQHCADWFWGSYRTQKAWLQQKLKESTARWKIVVTHFPCGFDGSWYRNLHERYGLDLLVTGHRHQQELWWKGTTSRYIRSLMGQNDLGDLTCLVSGGGGGITSDNDIDGDYGRDLLLYGFFDLTMSKDWINVSLIGLDGFVRGNVTIRPHDLRISTASMSVDQA